MSTLLWTNKTAGAVVGRKVVFTLQGAIGRYKKALELVYKDKGLDMSGAYLLGDIESDLINNCGIKPEDVEKIEIDFLKTL